MPAERRRLILEMLREHGSITGEEVQEQFGVSSMTARRDLGMLGDRGHLRRTHGGVSCPDPRPESSPSGPASRDTCRRSCAWAEAVTQALESHATVLLDSSSSS
jgi:DeoR/GlpR family transcriptional regulator of sugar metabolism